jgi:hypothetical protein
MYWLMAFDKNDFNPFGYIPNAFPKQCDAIEEAHSYRNKYLPSIQHKDGWISIYDIENKKFIVEPKGSK